MVSALELLDSMDSAGDSVCPRAVDKTDRTHDTAALAYLCTTLLALHERIAFLRCEERTARADRPALIAWVARQIDRLAERCGRPDGWIDPDDPFGDGVQIRILRAELEGLTAPDAPYPLGPLTGEPFSMTPPRRYNGKPA